ncbi:MAG TPA: hypothetical protein PLD86_05495 [Vicinamibacteria bacterium]|nr:hypothetical protein [Vicinamibacteria bacterium]
MTSALELLDLASGMLSRKYAMRPGLWPRASALLVRQALEESLTGYWLVKGIALEHCSTRAQLICLREYLREGDLASRLAYTWGALSRACHHHPYELPPTVEEIKTWMEPVRELHDVLVRG